jgi:AcrR family transcriptional regulator
MARPVRKLKDIEAAAIRLFAERGIGRVTTKEIAQEAGCAEGALYRHYPGLDELAWQLFKREVEKFGARLKEVLGSSDMSYPDRIRAGISLFYAFFDEDPVTFSFILLSEHQFAIRRRVNPKLSPEKLVLQLVRDGAAAGALGLRHPDLGAAMVLGLVLMPATMCATGELKGPLRQYVDETTAACLKILQPEGGKHEKGNRARTGKRSGS